MSDVEDVRAALSALRDALDGLPVDVLTHDETVAVMDEIETLRCVLPSYDRRLLTHLQAETTPRAMGATSWSAVLATRYRISSGEAHRRVVEAEVLGPRRSLVGEPLDPVLAATAAAQARGLVTGEHVDVIRKAYKRIPAWVDASTRVAIEADWAQVAVGTGPKPLDDHVKLCLFLLDQDGTPPDDGERQRRRGAVLGRQQHDLMSDLRVTLTPEGRAVLEAIFATWAAPGMCNPADETPCYSGVPSTAQIDADQRDLAQRQYDALIAMGRHVLASGVIGSHNGLPAAVVVRTTLQELEARAGIAVTAGGSVLPVSDVIAMAASTNANSYLAVFDGATGSAMNCYRARRTATVAQRLMLFARDGGCTKPNCTVPAYGCQAHHAVADWDQGGRTNVDEMALACGPNNREVQDGGWQTRMTDQHEVEWIPPPALDTGQTRINDYHHPEKFHRPARGSNSRADTPAERAAIRDDPWHTSDAADADDAAPTDTVLGRGSDTESVTDPADAEPDTATATAEDDLSDTEPQPAQLFSLCYEHHHPDEPEPDHPDPHQPGGPQPNAA